MLLHNTITGVIAAVMVALGAGQIGNTSTQVGEELVVGENLVTQSQERWFLLDVSNASNQDNPSEQIIEDMFDEDIPEPCDGGSIICAVKLDVSGLIDPEDLLGLSVAQATTTGGASHPGTGEEYVNRN